MAIKKGDVVIIKAMNLVGDIKEAYICGTVSKIYSRLTIYFDEILWSSHPEWEYLSQNNFHPFFSESMGYPYTIHGELHKISKFTLDNVQKEVLLMEV